MNCPQCDSSTRVLHTYAGHEVRRRRCCTSCLHRFSTTERSDDEQLGIDAKARRALSEAQQIIDELTARK